MAEHDDRDDADDESWGPTEIQRTLLESIRKDGRVPPPHRLFIHDTSRDAIVKQFAFLSNCHDCDDPECTLSMTMLHLDAVTDKEVARQMLAFALQDIPTRAEFVERFGSRLLEATPGAEGVKWIDTRFTTVLLQRLEALAMIELRIARMSVGVTDHVHTDKCDCKQVSEGFGDTAVTSLLYEPDGTTTLLACPMRSTDDGAVVFGEILDSFQLHHPDASPGKAN